MSGAPAKSNVSIPRLDVLRALCFLMVFGCHAFYTDDPAINQHPVWRAVISPLFSNGAVGVNVFFALSGFLISYLLIREKTTFGNIHVPKFWLRRVLRIWPLYFAVVVIGFVLFPMAKSALGQPVGDNGSVWSFLFFYNNLPMAHGFTTDSSILSVLWSIAVEEQFYLVWPLLLFALPVRGFPWAFAVVLLLSMVFKFTADTVQLRTWHTFSCMGDLATGALAACIAASERGARWVASWKWPAVLAIHLIWILLYVPQTGFAPPLTEVLDPVLFAFLSTAVILYQGFGGPTFLRMREFPVLVRLGRISYGLYCLHMVAILLVLQLLSLAGLHGFWVSAVLFPCTALVLSILFASISHRFLETPFLRLKDRFAFIVRG